MREIFLNWALSLCAGACFALLTTTANAQVTHTELAGNALSQYPYFEYVRAINENATVAVAIDPTRFPAIVGQSCDIHVVASKTISQWLSDPSLSDVTPGGAQTESFSGGSIQANTFQVTGPAQLNADAGAGLGVGYDVALDCDQDGSLSDGDYIDGQSGQAGFYAVHDTTAAGPYAVTDLEYSLSTDGGHMVDAEVTDSSRGVVFDWTDADKFYEWRLSGSQRNFSHYGFLSQRGAQGTQHPDTLAMIGDLTFSNTLRDGTGVTSTINVGAYGGGVERPYARAGGWHNEMETVQIRLTDFLNNGAGIDLTDIDAVRLEIGPSFGSERGRLVLNDLMLTSNVSPEPFEIVEPTTTRPAYAGTSVAGNRVLVRLVSHGGLDISPANLTITVDGTDLTSAQIPTAAEQVGGETWVVIAPGPKADGCYDLVASLTTPAGVSDIEASSLCYADDETRNFDRILAIDQTNSMHYDGTTDVFSTAKMDAARAAGRFFVDLSNANDQLGAVSFQRRDQNGDGSIVEPDELAEQVFPLNLIADGAIDRRNSMRNDISGIAPDTSPGFIGPETSPGTALVEAQTMLDSDGMTGHEPHIIILTDGLENYAPFWDRTGPHGSPLRPSFFDGDIRIDTIGIGGDADDILLTDMAEATGGEFRNLNEGAGSFFLLSRLANWYKGIDEAVRGEQRFFYQEGFPAETLSSTDNAAYSTLSAAGQQKVRIGGFNVQPALDWMTIAFHANIDNASKVNLYEPESSSPIAISPPGVTYHADAKHAVYRIRTPEPGLWIYTVEPKVLSAEFFAVASAPTSLTARVGPGQLARRAGGDYSMPFRVWVADDDAVLNATVAGFVRRPDGVKDTINLRDNGASMDGARNDGIYGLEYIASIPGAYSVDLKASGIAHNGEPFERYLSTAFYVPGDHKRPDQAGEGGTPRTPAGPCGGPVWCCWLWFAFFVALILSMLFFLRTACSCTETTHIFSRPGFQITALIILLVAILLGWWLLSHCTIALC